MGEMGIVGIKLMAGNGSSKNEEVIYMWDNPQTKGNFLDCHGWHRSVYNLCKPVEFQW